MSFGFLKQNQKALLRGPIASSLILNVLRNTLWKDVDYLVVDTPPGTGDINIHLNQDVVVTGAVIVTTPHQLSYIDVVKGIDMFDVMRIPVLGVIENMSYYLSECCSKKHLPFGESMLTSF